MSRASVDAKDPMDRTRPWPVAAASADGLAGLQNVFEEAASRNGGPIERSVTIAEGSVRLRFASAAIAERLTPAFSHLAEDDRVPKLTLDVWDSSHAEARRP